MNTTGLQAPSFHASRQSPAAGEVGPRHGVERAAPHSARRSLARAPTGLRRRLRDAARRGGPWGTRVLGGRGALRPRVGVTSSNENGFLPMCGRSRLPALRRYLRPLRAALVLGSGSGRRGGSSAVRKRALVRISAESADRRERDWGPLVRCCIVNPSKAVILAQAHRPSSAPGRRSFVRSELAAPAPPSAGQPPAPRARARLARRRRPRARWPCSRRTGSPPRRAARWRRPGWGFELTWLERSPAPAWAPRSPRSATSSATSRSCCTWPTASPARASTR